MDADGSTGSSTSEQCLSTGDRLHTADERRSRPTWPRAAPCLGERGFEDRASTHADQPMRTALFLTGDHRTAEDLLQDTLERTYLHWRRVVEPAACARTVMARAVTDRWRRLGRRSPRRRRRPGCCDPLRRAGRSRHRTASALTAPTRGPGAAPLRGTSPAARSSPAWPTPSPTLRGAAGRSRT
ncbi:sigma factor [Kineococcus sp. SYSU DK006]|uniref:sigma factor n=1 Tax=Kineococcus sp. SYSU DK006 TaxID=3383127 RepID=UPI003D7C43C1